ncbi:hypothetical protein ACFQE1_21970, partial [Halobium palmae]
GAPSAAELEAAAAVMREYDVRYLVVYNDETAARYEPFGPVVYRTEAFLVVDVDRRVRDGT